MASSPLWKVYNSDKEYRAACKDVEEAAVLVAFLGDGSTIRCDHALILWTEGKEDQPASESYDHVADVVNRRLSERRAAMKAKLDERAASLAAEHAARVRVGSR